MARGMAVSPSGSQAHAPTHQTVQAPAPPWPGVPWEASTWTKRQEPLRGRGEEDGEGGGWFGFLHLADRPLPRTAVRIAAAVVAGSNDPGSSNQPQPPRDLSQRNQMAPAWAQSQPTALLYKPRVGPRSFRTKPEGRQRRRRRRRRRRRQAADGGRRTKRTSNTICYLGSRPSPLATNQSSPSSPPLGY